jgi:hypothetical protein
MANLVLPAEKRRATTASNLKRLHALKMSNFGIHFWICVTLVTVLKRGNDTLRSSQARDKGFYVPPETHGSREGVKPRSRVKGAV